MKYCVQACTCLLDRFIFKRCMFEATFPVPAGAVPNGDRDQLEGRTHIFKSPPLGNAYSMRTRSRLLKLLSLRSRRLGGKISSSHCTGCHISRRLNLSLGLCGNIPRDKFSSTSFPRLDLSNLFSRISSMFHWSQTFAEVLLLKILTLLSSRTLIPMSGVF